MRTHPIRDSSGNLLAFEVENLLIGGATIGRIVKAKLGAAIIPHARSVIDNRDVRLAFQLDGVQFVVVEPFGDSSRYWIGPSADDLVPTPLIEGVHEAIAKYSPTPLGWLRTFRRVDGVA
jgi:hypothetical protein